MLNTKNLCVLTFHNENPIISANNKPIICPRVSARHRRRREHRIEAIRLPGGTFEHATGTCRRETSGSIATDYCLQLEGLSYANELDLAGVLLEAGVFGGVGDHVGEGATIQHCLQKEIQ